MKWYMWSSALLVGIIMFVIILVAGINSADTYKGQVNFATESDYSAFKQELISTNAKYFDNSNPPSVYVDVLNQQPPILINFRIKVDKGVNFSYGTKSTQLTNNIGLMVLIPILMGFTMMLMWCIIDLFRRIEGE